MVYLLLQIWAWLLIAAAAGLAAGWFIWGWSGAAGNARLKNQLYEVEERNRVLEFFGKKAGLRSYAKIPVVKHRGKDAPQFLDAPDGEPDDLTLIKGIGPTMEYALNGLGIYHFRQIAAFSEVEINRIDKFLKFHGRINREDWVGQAKKLHRSEIGGTYGTGAGDSPPRPSKTASGEAGERAPMD